ncbi:hypothetical protein LY76DRAFT_106765 [Colletotrichum caudatum]|nr:hypothetical protein LY76DRAFT_106765 [Colletotrichum caudatum]
MQAARLSPTLCTLRVSFLRFLFLFPVILASPFPSPLFSLPFSSLPPSLLSQPQFLVLDKTHRKRLPCFSHAPVSQQLGSAALVAAHLVSSLPEARLGLSCASHLGPVSD